ncbi:hypothetical protein HDE_06562 [Halotydeus destructor]|nr:hypothetical protein HDE_06562 [Halotydeus destructor]
MKSLMMKDSVTEEENEHELVIAELERMLKEKFTEIQTVNKRNVSPTKGSPAIHFVAPTGSVSQESKSPSSLCLSSPLKEEADKKLYLKIDLTRDNDFERFIYEQPRNFELVELEPVFMIQTAGTCSNKNKEPQNVESVISIDSQSKKRRRSQQQQTYSPLSPPRESDDSDESKQAVKGMEPPAAKRPRARKIPPPRTPSPPPPASPKKCTSPMKTMPLSPSLTPPLLCSANNPPSSNVCETTKFSDYGDTDLRNPVIQSSFPSNHDSSVERDQASVRQSWKPEPFRPSWETGGNGQMYRQFNCDQRNQPTVAPNRGYPTYFERFLATVFSWNPDWYDRSDLNLINSKESLKLPSPFYWLEEGMAYVISRNFQYENYKDFRAFYAQYLLLLLFDKIHEATRTVLSSPSSEAREDFGKIRSISDYRRKDSKEKAFLSEVRFTIRKKPGSWQPFKRGDLLTMRRRPRSEYRNYGLILECRKLVDEQQVGGEPEVVYQYLAVMKKTIARKFSDELKLVCERIVNIDKYLMKAKAVYDFGSYDSRRFSFSKNFVKPSNFSDALAAMKHVVTVPGHERFTLDELNTIKLATNFVQVPEDECDRILGLAADSSKSDSTFKMLFIELVTAVLQSSEPDAKHLVVIGCSDSDEESQWLEQFTSDLGHSVKTVRACEQADQFALLARWDSLVSRLNQDDRQAGDETLTDIRYHIENSDDFTEELAHKEQQIFASMNQDCIDQELNDARVVVATISQLLSNRQHELLRRTPFKSCIVYDNHFDDVDICCLAALYNVSSLIVYGKHGQPSKMADLTTEKLKPDSFMERLHRCGCTFKF